MPYASRICSIFPLWMESKALVKSTNINVACRFFARTPSRILRMVNICELVDLFLREPFWFFLSMFLANPRSPFLGKGSMHPFIHLSIYRILCIPSSIYQSEFELQARNYINFHKINLIFWYKTITYVINLHHHHHVTPSARISLTLCRHPSLSSIASGRSSGLHPVSTQSCCK